MRLARMWRSTRSDTTRLKSGADYADALLRTARVVGCYAVTIGRCGMNQTLRVPRINKTRVVARQHCRHPARRPIQEML